ncbi:MAG: ferrochelatase [Actinomycetes bacterium]
MTTYDALLVVSFGGPDGPDDVVPFLRNVTHGRGIPEDRLRVVGEHYFHFGGVSPINAQNRALISGVEADLAARSTRIPVYWGNRNWTPYLTETVQQMREDGVRRALAFFTSAYSSYSGCRQYRENLADARAAGQSIELVIDRIGPYYNHPGFVLPFVDSTEEALHRLPDAVRDDARLVFTTHSLPLSMAHSSGPDRDAYVTQHREVATWVADAVAARTGVDREWDLVFQSRSGPPSQPWLEPDVGDHVVELHADGVPAVVVVPIGFVSDHMEVVWDLDTQARAQADAVGLLYERAATPGCEPRFVTMVGDLLVERQQDVPMAQRVRMAGSFAAPDRCAAGCCPNPRGPRQADAGDD